MILDREPRNIPIHQRDTIPEHGNNNLVHQESICLEQTGFNELNGNILRIRSCIFLTI